MKGSLYPAYYTFPFHNQTDGWLSSRSAEVYDVSSEVIFTGKQDAMQRLTLIPLGEYLDDFEHSNSSSQKPVIVELGAGTGRFGTFVRDNVPSAHYILNDLSPFYLEKARKTMARWERVTGAGGGDVRYVHGRAESLPLESCSADIVFSVYLLHELPHAARKLVVEEAARILKPGGLFVITDSIQLGDRPSIDEGIEGFGQFSEPWFVNYLSEDLGQLVAEGGLFKPLRKELRLATKCLSFRRSEKKGEFT